MLLLCRVTVLCVLLYAMLSFSAHMQAAPLAQDASVRLSCRVEPAPLPLNREAILVLEIENVENLYGYELDIYYDLARIQMQDADSNQAGTNLDLANKFLSPDFVVENAAEGGILLLAMAQLAPSQAKSGSGELARISFVGTAVGFANFSFAEVIFSNSDGIAIPLTIQDCLVEIGTPGAPTPTVAWTATATWTATPLPSLTPIFSPTPVNMTSPTSDAAQVAGVNAATATFTSLPPTATFTPAPQGAAPTGISPTATFSPIPPPATETATPFVPPTATVLVVSTPTPVIDSSVGGDPRTQEQQPSPMPTDPIAGPMATPSVVVNDAPMDGGTSPTVTSLPPTAQPFTDPAAISSSAEAPPAIPTLAQEALSPPQVTQEPPVQPAPDVSVDPTDAVPVVDVPGDAPIAAAIVAPSSTPTATPLVIAQAEARLPRAKIVVDQPEPVHPLSQGEVLRLAAWITLLCASLLAIIAWRLRRS